MAGRGPAVVSRDVEPSLRVESHVKIYVRDDDPPLGRTTIPYRLPSLRFEDRGSTAAQYL